MALILRNHGLMAAGRSAGEALHYMFNLVHACEVSVAACAAAGGNIDDLCELDDSTVASVHATASGGGGGVTTTTGPPPPVGSLEFDAAVRSLDLPWDVPIQRQSDSL